MNIVLDCRVCVCPAWSGVERRAAAEALVPVLLAHTSPQGAGTAPSALPPTLTLTHAHTHTPCYMHAVMFENILRLTPFS